MSIIDKFASRQAVNSSAFTSCPSWARGSALYSLLGTESCNLFKKDPWLCVCPTPFPVLRLPYSLRRPARSSTLPVAPGREWPDEQTGVETIESFPASGFSAQKGLLVCQSSVQILLDCGVVRACLSGFGRKPWQQRLHTDPHPTATITR